jgi:hypothetical protein
MNPTIPNVFDNRINEFVWYQSWSIAVVVCLIAFLVINVHRAQAENGVIRMT